MPNSETIRKRVEAREREAEAREANGKSQDIFNGAFSAPTGGSGERSQTPRQRAAEGRRRARESQREAREERERKARELQTGFELGGIVQPKANISDASEKVLRYPRQALGGGNITADSDYVLFEFYKYAPPFKGQSGDQNYRSTERVDPTPDRRNAQQRRKGIGRTRSNVLTDKRTNLLATAGNVFDYNRADDYERAGDDYNSIIMYMPEDISTGFKANWGGKAFSNIATDVLRSAGAEGLNKLDNAATGLANAIERLPALGGSAAIRKGIQKITGDSLSNDDVFGAISGAILNPNTELLFSGHDMRNFQLNFKMVPRNVDESVEIQEICRVFKMCTLPSKNPGKIFGATNQGLTAGFIGVPNLCKVSFMKGPGQHPALPVYKICAVTQVDVNYTPDGAYATYSDGSPVAIQLSINFQETKLVFAEDIANNGVR